MGDSLRQITVLSGKGGTGKTSLAASLLPFLPKTVTADCDVDAPDLDILLKPKERRRNPFFGGVVPVINAAYCVGCGDCVSQCRFHALALSEPGADSAAAATAIAPATAEVAAAAHAAAATPAATVEVAAAAPAPAGIFPAPAGGRKAVLSPVRCEGCGLCEAVCRHGAVSLQPREVGMVLEGETRYGPMVYGKLYPGEENSGKLVAAVRELAEETARREGCSYLLVDGSPGVGCAVIAAVKGADCLLAVTEPTQSGVSDLSRLTDLAFKLQTPIRVILNKADLSQTGANAVRSYCQARHIPLVLEIPFIEGWLQAINEAVVPSVRLTAELEAIGFPAFVRSLVQSIR